eukprot:Rhum_TRINITY_DN13379_c0_g1::Rhum_TRINITY_DN13379_c0_g1_i2::g.59525::m.59525
MSFQGGLKGVAGTFSLVEEDACYIEAWIPTSLDDSLEDWEKNVDAAGSLRCGDAWVARDAEKFANLRKTHERSSISGGLLEAATTSQSAVWKAELTAEDLPGFNALEGGDQQRLRAGALPVTHDNKLVVVFLFLYWEGKTPTQAKIEKLRGDITIAVQNVIGGSVERVEDAMYADIAKVFENQMLAVKEILRREDVFSGTTIEEDVATFYNLGISSLYFGQNNPAQIAKHLTSFIGAKRAATVSGGGGGGASGNGEAGAG